jgi:hypothetical protein
MLHDRRDKRRLPDCMLCVLDHLTRGLPPGPRSLLVCYARHAHDAGCGIYPSLRRLGPELRTSPVTLRQWRTDLQDRGLIERLPRAAPRGADLLRLGPCPEACSQRDSMQARCKTCECDNLKRAESVWWAAQRDYMQSRKSRELQAVPAGTTRGTDEAAAVRSPEGDGTGRLDGWIRPAKTSNGQAPRQQQGSSAPFQADDPADAARVGALQAARWRESTVRAPGYPGRDLVGLGEDDEIDLDWSGVTDARGVVAAMREAGRRTA